MNVRIVNNMNRVFVVPIEGKPEILPRLSKVVDKELFDKALKGNPALQSHVQENRIVLSEVAVNPTEPAEPVAEEDVKVKTSNPERPAELEETADAEAQTSGKAKVKHAVKSVEHVEIPEGDAPKGGKRGSKKKGK